MEFRKITAIVRSDRLENVENRLKSLGVKGISVSRIKGYGEYADFFRSDWLTTHSRIEIFAAKEEIEPIVDAILQSAHSGLPGDGMIAVLPVEKLYRVKTRSEAGPHEI